LWSLLVRDFRTEISYRCSFILNLSGIFFSAVTFFFTSELIGQVTNPYLQEYDGDYFSFVIIGIIAVGIIMIIKRGEPLTCLFGAFANLVGGIYYPVAILPARLIPATYAVRAMRLALLAGASWSAIMPDILALLVFIIVLFPLALLVFGRDVETARMDGSLAHY